MNKYFQTGEFDKSRKEAGNEISSVLNFELVDKKNFITEHKRLTGKINLFDLPTN